MTKDMPRDLAREEVRAYQRDGVIRVEQAVEREWVHRLLGVVDRQLAKPGRWAVEGGAESRGRSFHDRYLWREDADIRAYIFESGVARLAAQAMQSSAARFYFDHTLVKEPGTATPTPWHQDAPYWPFQGRQICSVWLALTDVTVAESAMEFVRGSHATGKYYLPTSFSEKGKTQSAWLESAKGEPVPPIQDNRADFDIVGWDMKAGDAVLFSAWLLHWAPGNSSTTRRRAAVSTRWLGDDAVWDPRPGTDPTVTQADVSVAPGEPARDDKVFPVVWPAGGRHPL